MFSALFPLTHRAPQNACSNWTNNNKVEYNKQQWKNRTNETESGGLKLLVLRMYERTGLLIGREISKQNIKILYFNVYAVFGLYSGGSRTVSRAVISCD